MIKRPKILFLVQLPPPVHGAAVINNYLQNSKEVNYHLDSTFLNITTADAINDIGFFNLSKLFKSLGIYWACFKKLYYLKPRIVYITLSPIGWGFLKDSILVIISKLFCNKIVIHTHGKGILEAFYTNFWTKRYYHFIYRNTFCIFLSQILAEDFPQQIPLKKKIVLNNGIFVTPFNPQTIRKNDIIQLLFLSNLVKSKGIYEYLEVCKKLHELNISFNARIVGKPFDVKETDIQEFINTNKLHHKLHYLGAKYDDEKYTILNETDVLIFPTMYKNEAFPLVLLEAMQFGILSITTPEGGIPDIIEDGKNGFIVPHNAVDAIVEKIVYLQNNKQALLKMSETCKKEFSEKYTLEVFENKFIKIMQSIL